MIGKLLAQIEQLWYVPVRLSPRGATWVAAYWWLQRPLQLRGTVRRYMAEHEGRRFTIVTIVTIGHQERTVSFCEDILERMDATGDAGTRSLADPAALTDIDADMVVTDIHPRFAAPFRALGWIIVPEWIRWCGDPALLPPRSSRSLKSDLNKIRAYAYELEPAGTSDDWNEFYNDMVVPYAMQRFDDIAWVPSRLFFSVLRRRGMLHFVRRDGRRVAGFCALASQHRAWFPLLGTLPDPALRGEGTLAAVYAFTFDWARANNFVNADVGRSSVFVSDGVGKYKKKWGLQPTPDPVSRLLAVWPGPAMRGLFAREPVYVITDDGLDIYAGADRRSMR